ncbi:MAG: ATP-binding cassette domain-containing protein, partial [Burkholderiales bacterium]|nr:ATP-binding cassette domain-containing protein [Burkholderiales bacterium]
MPAAECDNLIEIRDLHFAYGRRKVLEGLELDIPRGRVVAILGASGCGKSTLLQLIGGALRPARGTVKVCGQDVHALDH